jgi:hypothetical protein
VPGVQAHRLPPWKTCLAYSLASPPLRSPKIGGPSNTFASPSSSTDLSIDFLFLPLSFGFYNEVESTRQRLEALISK